MLIKKIINENLNNVKIKGMVYSLTTDEKRLYDELKNKSKVFEKDFSEYDNNVLVKMVSKGYIKRCRNRQGDIFYVARGRVQDIPSTSLKEVAPPDKDSENWIKKNKEKFKKKYGKNYAKFLYGKAWNNYNGKKLNESSLNTLVEMVTAHHGSAYDFDEFDVRFISSGEGFQAHGWGLYFSLNKDIAKGYQNRIGHLRSSQGASVVYNYDGNSYTRGTLMYIILDMIQKQGKKDALKYISEIIKDKESVEGYEENVNKIKTIKKMISSIAEKEIKSKISLQVGQFYTVKIPDLDNMLDEDDIIPNQSKKVQSCIKKMIKDYPLINPDKLKKSSGEGFYRFIRDNITKDSPMQASKLLLKYGIKGIKYKGDVDGDCIVIFDSADVKIINKEVKRPSMEDEIKLTRQKMLEADPESIQDIENPTTKEQMTVLKISIANFQYIKNPSDEAVEYVLEKNFSWIIKQIKSIPTYYLIRILNRALEDGSIHDILVVNKECATRLDKDEFIKFLNKHNNLLLYIQAYNCSQEKTNTFYLEEMMKIVTPDNLRELYVYTRESYNNFHVRVGKQDAFKLSNILFPLTKMYDVNDGNMGFVLNRVLFFFVSEINSSDLEKSEASELRKMLLHLDATYYEKLTKIDKSEVKVLFTKLATLHSSLYLKIKDKIKDDETIKEVIDQLYKQYGDNGYKFSGDFFDIIDIDEKIRLVHHIPEYLPSVWSNCIDSDKITLINNCITSKNIKDIFKRDYHLFQNILQEYNKFDVDVQNIFFKFLVTNDYKRELLSLIKNAQELSYQQVKLLATLNPALLKYIKQPIDERIQIRVIEKNPFNIRWINNPTANVVKKAYEMNPQTKDYIRG